MGNAVINGMPLEAFMELRDEIDTLQKELMEIKHMLFEEYHDPLNTHYIMIEKEKVGKILGIIEEETTCTIA